MRTPDDVRSLRDMIKPFLDIGMDHVVIVMPAAYQSGLVSMVAREVEPLLG